MSRREITPKSVIVELTGNIESLAFMSVIGKQVRAEAEFVDDEIMFRVLCKHLTAVSSSFRLKRATYGVNSVLFKANEVKLVKCLLMEGIDDIPENETDTAMWDYLELLKHKEQTDDSAGPYARQRRYNEAVTVMKSIRLNKHTDEDILLFLEDKAFQPTVKQALREMMKRSKRK